MTIAPPAALLPPPAPTSLPPAIVLQPLMPPAHVAWPSNWVNAWIPLEAWGRYNALGRPTQLPGGALPVFQFQTSNGPLALTVNSRLVMCNSLECWLGYAPQILKGIACIHWLD